MVSAPASTGSASSSRKAVISTDHANSGMRNIVMPGARILMIVAMKLIEPRIEDAPARCIDKMTKSAAGPGVPDLAGHRRIEHPAAAETMHAGRAFGE